MILILARKRKNYFGCGRNYFNWRRFLFYFSGSSDNPSNSENNEDIKLIDQTIKEVEGTVFYRCKSKYICFGR